MWVNDLIDTSRDVPIPAAPSTPCLPRVIITLRFPVRSSVAVCWAMLLSAVPEPLGNADWCSALTLLSACMLPT